MEEFTSRRHVALMTSEAAMSIERPEAGPPRPADDYAKIAKAIEFIQGHRRDQPSIEAVARRVGLSEQHLRALFRRWADVTPKAFLEALTLDHARALLRGQADLLDVSLEAGLSGPSRLHDLFVTHEAMTAGQFERGGAGMTLRYGFHPSPFGEAVLVATERGLAGLGFVEGGDRAKAVGDVAGRWANAKLLSDREATAPYARRVFDPTQWKPDRPLRLVLIGTNFEATVWEALLGIEMGRAVAYSAIARQIGRPNAARAVGAAVGKNPVSFVVPCHRVLGSGGAPTGYHWGLVRKQAIIAWEAGRLRVRPDL